MFETEELEDDAVDLELDVSNSLVADVDEEVEGEEDGREMEGKPQGSQSSCSLQTP